MSEEKNLQRLDTTLIFEKKNGVKITVSTVCGGWDNMQKFLSDFENTLLKGNNGQSKHQRETKS
jgi:hypothetical protein